MAVISRGFLFASFHLGKKLIREISQRKIRRWGSSEKFPWQTRAWEMLNNQLADWKNIFKFTDAHTERPDLEIKLLTRRLVCLSLESRAQFELAAHMVSLRLDLRSKSSARPTSIMWRKMPIKIAGLASHSQINYLNELLRLTFQQLSLEKSPLIAARNWRFVRRVFADFTIAAGLSVSYDTHKLTLKPVRAAKKLNFNSKLASEIIFH